jgi:hypothetical protein
MQVTTVGIIVSLTLAVLALAWCFALAQRLRKVTAVRGDLARIAAAGDLPGLAREVGDSLAALAARDERLQADDEALAARLQTAIRHVGLVRFDALPGDVGEQSFAVALLDDRATGFVLTSMYGRGAYRLYAKPVVEGVSELVLTNEEMQATADALVGTGLQVVGERRPRASL